MKLIILTGAQRSGTTALATALRKTGSVHNCGEIFHEYYLAESENFFKFLENSETARSLYWLPSEENRTTVWDMYLAYLSDQISLPYALIDVKYNSFHHLDTFWRAPTTPPFLLSLLSRADATIIHMRRDNVFKMAVSAFYANSIGKYHYGSGVKKDQEDPPMFQENVGRSLHLFPHDVLQYMKIQQDSRTTVETYVAGSPNLFSLLYEDFYVDDQPCGVGAQELADHLGVPSPLRTPLHPTPMPIRSLVENADELIAYFAGTPYEAHVAEALA